ncbi:MAG: hypothetical protein AAF376_17965 [Pseudomonadota bacterium]
MARLVVHRGTGWTDFFRGYKVFLGDREIGLIRRKSTLSVDIPAGRHVLHATIDWTRAEPITIEANADDTIHVEVSNTHGALKAEYAVTVGKDTYLTLKQLDGPPSR